ncbi:MAG: hypothetical protein HYV60_00315 [Planctomycetia bacterium]|nr:hypothetical protein [Planctomycetia bacterium]
MDRARPPWRGQRVEMDFPDVVAAAREQQPTYATASTANRRFGQEGDSVFIANSSDPWYVPFLPVATLTEQATNSRRSDHGTPIPNQALSDPISDQLVGVVR